MIGGVLTKNSFGKSIGCNAETTLGKADVYRVTSPNYPNRYSFFRQRFVFTAYIHRTFLRPGRIIDYLFVIRRCERTFNVQPNIEVAFSCRDFSLSGQAVRNGGCWGDALDFYYGDSLILEACGNSLNQRDITGFPKTHTGYKLSMDFNTYWGQSNTGFDCTIQGISTVEQPPVSTTPAPGSSSSTTQASNLPGGKRHLISRICPCSGLHEILRLRLWRGHARN